MFHVKHFFLKIIQRNILCEFLKIFRMFHVKHFIPEIYINLNLVFGFFVLQYNAASLLKAGSITSEPNLQ